MGILAAALALIGAYNIIMTAIKNHREERRERNSPVTQLRERVDQHDKMLAKGSARMDSIDEKVHDMGLQSTIMLRGVRALLSHEINGNSNDKLKSSMTEIDDYLIGRK